MNGFGLIGFAQTGPVCRELCQRVRNDGCYRAVKRGQRLGIYWCCLDRDRFLLKQAAETLFRLADEIEAQGKFFREAFPQFKKIRLVP